MTPEAYGMLGILNRAGMTLFGPSLEGRMKKGYLLLLAQDASERIVKDLRLKAASFQIPTYDIESKEELGAPLGRDELSAVLILSQKGAKSLLDKLQKGERK